MWKRQQGGTNVLLEECEAFLAGTLAEYWDEKGFVVPVWAWTNLLAHGSQGLIGDCVVRPNPSRRAVRSWRVARAHLASEVLNLTAARFTLGQLQASVLVPLELELAARPEVSRWAPRQWIVEVDRAIRNQHTTLEQ